MQGRLHQAWQTYESIRLNAQAAGQEPLIMTGEVFGHLSDLYLEWNDLEQAAAYARQEVTLAQSGQMLFALADGYLKVAAVAAAEGDEAQAQEALNLAADTAVQFHSSTVAAEIAMHQTRYALLWGNFSTAAAWADQYAQQRAAGDCPLPPLLAHTADLLLARIWLAQGRTEQAVELLHTLVQQLEAVGRLRLVTEANVLLALALSVQGQPAAAQKAIIRALALAKQEGYVRVFADNGQALLPLLGQVRHLFPEYVAKLLQAIPTSAAAAAFPSPLLDPLTEREQEILCLIAQGHTNRQIADALFISVGTVKGHVNHIFSKMDVQNRTQALLRAREYHLLDQ
jgi:LuxR family transcriptional regulator, maltose regulon positive regulatory protein